MTTPSLERQNWLHKAEVALRRRFHHSRDLFAESGYDGNELTIPDLVRVSIGWPKGARDGKMTIGQCWATTASSDEHSEIFISPQLGHDGKGSVDGSVLIIATLAHEFVHAAVGNKAGHRRKFQKAAAAVGLVKPWTATVGGAEFNTWAAGIVKEIGTFPAGKLSLTERRKGGTRLLKCECEGCGYNVRTTRKWIEAAGAPICPTDKMVMACDINEPGDDDEGAE